MSEVLVTLCRAHETLRQKEQDTREERADLRSAKTALGEMALDSMQRHSVECISMPPGLLGAEGRPLFARICHPAPRHKPFTCEEDAIALLHSASFDASAVPHDVRADMLVRMIKARAAADAAARAAASPAPPRITLVSSQPRNGVVSTSAPPETRELLAQYATTCKDIRETTRALKPYRDRKRTAEQSAVTTLTEPVAIRVRNGESEHTLRVVRKERVRKASLNMRTFLRLVRECVEKVNDAVATDDFDRALEHALRVRVQEALAPPAPTAVVRVLGHGGRAAAPPAAPPAMPPVLPPAAPP